MSALINFTVSGNPERSHIRDLLGDGKLGPKCLAAEVRQSWERFANTLCGNNQGTLGKADDNLPNNNDDIPLSPRLGVLEEYHVFEKRFVINLQF